MDGNVERRARDEILVVQIARLNPWGIAAEASGSFRRRDAHAAEKRMQRNFDAGSEARDHAVFVERNDFHFRIGKIFRQKSAPWSKRIVRVRNRELRAENSYF